MDVYDSRKVNKMSKAREDEKILTKEKKEAQETQAIIRFEIGDFIIYGSNGVCKITDCGKLDSVCASKDKLYYTVEPYYTTGTKIYTPVDNDKVVMRPIVTKEEAISLIDEINEIENLWIADEKRREQEYKQSIQKCDCKELVRIIKTIYLRKQSRLAEGKKVTASDEKYFRIAEEQLYGELAVSLEMDKNETKEYVINRVKQNIGEEDTK